MAEVVDKKVAKSNVATKIKGITKDTYLNWYEVMLRIRRFEEASLKAYSQQKIRGFLHVYIGQEAIAAGLVSALTIEDKIATAYRQHGIALSRGISSRKCMAELFGKATGVVKGKGGSMHFSSKAHGYIGGNGIVGAQIPIGTGVALAEQYKGTNNLCVTMFGDGAARQGALHESFNMAMTWKLPVIYIIENNKYAMGTSVERTSNVTDLTKVGASYEMPAEKVDGMDVEAVHEAIAKAAKWCRDGKGPYLLEMETYRFKGHSMSDPRKYRTKEEEEEYQEEDPIKKVLDVIKKNKYATDAALEKIHNKIKKQITDAIQFAEDSPLPEPEAMYEDIYAEAYPFIKD